MKHRQTVCTCGFSEDAVLAAAIAEADATEQQAVALHICHCQVCARLFAQYRGIQHALTRLQDSREFEACLRQAVEKLLPRLRSRLRKPLHYRQFASAVGELTIATSPQGISLVAWQPKAVRLLAPYAIREDGEALQALERELAGYFAGVRTQFDWPLDDVFMTSAFQRAVLHLTAAIPYGAVMSYQSLAAALGRPKAVRAVAQALRRNPLAIVIPCHRVVGRSGHLTGYAGGLETKSALLAHEGVPLLTRRHGVFVDRSRMFVGWRSSRYYCRPQCPSLRDLAPGETLLLSPRALQAQGNFAPCDLCHPEAVSV
jgi:methylated-DNA-[protein]-cysteine S-methyltransferase